MIQRLKMYLSVVGFWGLVYLIKSKVIYSVDLFKIKRPNFKHPFHVRVPSSDIDTFVQIFINQEYNFLVESHPKTIVDAGANIGLASIYFANKYPDAKIIAIEPEQSNYELLKKNIAPYPNIIPLQAALWNKNEELDLIDPGLGNWGFMTTLKDSSEHHSCHSVMAITIDKIIENYNLEKIDVLKIDIEGAEKEVFNDTSSWIEKVDSLIVELHDRMKGGCSRSFYSSSNGFDNEWKQGENVYLSRGNCLIKHSP